MHTDTTIDLITYQMLCTLIGCIKTYDVILRGNVEFIKILTLANIRTYSATVGIDMSWTKSNVHIPKTAN